jgi:hypothetical protein
MTRIEVLRQLNGAMLVTAAGHVVEVGPNDNQADKVRELSSVSGVPAHLIEVHITRATME